ncbi:MAG TPA: amidase [Acetobacteraceae bacterium]|nr:amidase [Acetobacteraceae bacterium]
MTDLHWLTAAEAAAAFRARTLSPVEYLQALLARIAAVDPQINAFIRLDADAALAAARAAEAEIAAGRARGPLHGIPVGIKDIIDVAGLPTTCHSRVLLDNVAAADAAVVARLRAAGAIPFGKLSTHEFAIGGPSFDLPFPPARNPWNINHHPGGSSSGPGAGLGAGLFPLAIGSDTGGSIRNPAAACGVVGLKPTYGLVSRRGVFPLAFSLDHVGPMARTPEDAALLLDAIAGHDAADPGSRPGPARSFAADLDRGVRGLTIGYVRHFHETDTPANPAVSAALDEAARVLEAEGARIVPIALPPLPDFATVNRTILYAEAWAVHAPWLRTRPQDYGRLGRRNLMVGAFLDAGAYVQAQRHRGRLIAAVQGAFREVDLLLCASNMEPACRIDDPETIGRTYSRQARTPFNVTGHPALAMLSGFTASGSAAEGMPLALQLVGRYFEDGTVLRAAAAFRRATNWHTRRPPLA